MTRLARWTTVAACALAGSTLGLALIGALVPPTKAIATFEDRARSNELHRAARAEPTGEARDTRTESAVDARPTATSSDTAPAADTSNVAEVSDTTAASAAAGEPEPRDVGLRQPDEASLADAGRDWPMAPPPPRVRIHPPHAQQAAPDTGAVLNNLLDQLPQGAGGGTEASSLRDQVQRVMETVNRQREETNAQLDEMLEDSPIRARRAAEARAAAARAAEGEPAPTPEGVPPGTAETVDTGETSEPASDDGIAQFEAGEDGLVIHIKNGDLRNVLELLSEQGSLNILATKSVTGTVSASLNGVDVESALDAILKSTGYIWRREGQFIYVGTTEDFQNVDRAIDKIATRIYRPNYITAAELQTLLTPILSDGDIGKISVTSAAQSGIGGGGGGGTSGGGSTSGTGGDSFASNEAVLIQDYESNLQLMDQVVSELDRRPMQVSIEAMILSVKLNDNYKFGIDWQLLRQRDNIRLGIGTPRQAPLAGGGNVDGTTGAPVGAYQFTPGGLTFAFLDSNLGSFLSLLETMGDTNVIATPRLMCLNKQRAEILIGAQLGYISTTITETASTQSVNFLEVGAQLRLRPFISTDGVIRMEVHPELSTGSVKTQGGFTLPDKEVTQVTTNIMTRDGCTVVIGGLMREDLSTSNEQIPLLGDLPAVGFLFRKKNETLERREILVLVTPHVIYDCEANEEGQQGAMEFHRRQGVRLDHTSPFGKRLLGRKYFRAAQAAWEQGDAKAAARYIQWAVRFDPENRAAIDLKHDIVNGRHDGKHSSGPLVLDPEMPATVEEMPDWMLDEVAAEGPPVPDHPLDPGQPGAVRHLHRPSPTAEE